MRQWEEGTLQPTVRQLRLLGNAAKRPLAVFYLAEPPWKFTALRDFRRLPGDPGQTQTSALRLAVRSACERRQVALDLAADLDQVPPPLPLTASLHEPVVGVARRMRELLGVSVERAEEVEVGIRCAERLAASDPGSRGVGFPGAWSRGR